MRRLGIVLAAAAGITLALPATANALDGNTDYQAGCLAAGGEFTAVPPLSTRAGDQCTIVTGGTDTETVPASHPRQAWTVVVETTNETTTVYEVVQEGRDAVWREISSTTVGGPGTGTVISCSNHQGNAITDFKGNPNCRPLAG